MAKGKGSIKGWITKNGVHIPIYSEYTVRGGVEPKAKGAKFKGGNKRKKPDLNAIKGYASDPRTATGDPTVIKVGDEEYFKSGENRWERHSANGRVLSSSISDEKMNDIIQKHDGDVTVNEGKGATKAVEGKKERPNDLKARDIHGKERLINRKDLEDALTEAKSKAEAAVNTNEWRQYEDTAKEIQKALDGGEISPLVAQNYGKLSAKKKPSMSEEDKTARTVADHYGVSVDKAKEGIASGKYSDDDIKTAKDYKATMKNLEDKRDAGSISAEDYESSRKEAIKGFNESRKAKVEAGQEESNDDPHPWTTSPNELIRNYEAKKKAKQEESKPRTSADNREERIAALKEKINAKTQERVEEYRKDDPNYKDGKYLKEQESAKSNLGSMSDKELTDAYKSSTDKDEKYNIAIRLNARGYSLQDDRETWQKTGSPADESKFGQRARDYKASLQQSGGEKPASAQVSRIIHGDKQEGSTSTSTPERKKYKSEGVMQAFKSAKEMTGRSDLTLHQLAQDGLEDHYSFRDKDGNEIGRFSNPHTSRAGYMTLNTSATGDKSKPISKQDSLSAGTNERSRIRGELHAKDKAMKAAMPTTVSGLRSAYADATGSMKSKIAAELRRKGYSFVGGKWVKGK